MHGPLAIHTKLPNVIIKTLTVQEIYVTVHKLNRLNMQSMPIILINWGIYAIWCWESIQINLELMPPTPYQIWSLIIVALTVTRQIVLFKTKCARTGRRTDGRVDGPVDTPTLYIVATIVSPEHSSGEKPPWNIGSEISYTETRHTENITSN